MGVVKLFLFVLSLLIVWVAYKAYKLSEVPQLPELKSEYWGPGSAKQDDPAVRPFKIDVSEDVLVDLKRRLGSVRTMMPPLEGANFRYGYNSEAFKNVLDYWRNKYDWRKREAFLNSLPQFKTQVQGLDIHFIHMKPTNTQKKTIPLLVLHGWPGSVREFYSMIPILMKTNADYAFEIVAPSLPGYGWSQPSSKKGLGPAQVGVVFKNLMAKLGHDKFYIHGGDWGAVIAANMATLFPENVRGIHSTMCSSHQPISIAKLFIGSYFPSLIMSERHQAKLYPLKRTFAHLMEESGYMHIQATKPDTVGTALNDSPAGLAAYILEKFSTWTDPANRELPDGGLTKKFSYDDLLDNIMIYWVTGSITTSMRIYSENFSKKQMALKLDSIPTHVPTACARFRHEILNFPDSIIKDKYPNLVQANDFDDGGHFASMELPQVVADDIVSAINKMEKLKK